MPTPYDRVFSVFTSQIEDDSYSLMTQEEAETDMIDLLNNSITNFEYPKVNIRDKDDDTKEFAEDLSLDEINIIGNLMLVEWLNRKLYKSSLLSQHISSKEYRLTSQAEHLNTLQKLQSNAEKRIQRMMMKYSYRQTGSSYSKPNYSGLVGDET